MYAATWAFVTRREFGASAAGRDGRDSEREAKGRESASSRSTCGRGTKGPLDDWRCVPVGVRAGSSAQRTTTAMEQIRAACEADRAGKHHAAVELYVVGLERLVQQHATDPSMGPLIEQHTARLEALVGEIQLQSTAVVTTTEQLRPGQHVYYESSSVGRWIEGKVLRVHSDGTVSLDVRARADRRRIRTTRPRM